MPQSGDGDLWPTTDDDSGPAGKKDAETHELPVPDQQKQPEKPKTAPGGWFDSPTGAPEKDTSAEATPTRDEPHAKPAQQITQPVSWPVADLERQAQETPKPADEKTDFVKRPAKDTPAWPGAESTPRKENPATSFAQPLKDTRKEDATPSESDGGKDEPQARPEDSGKQSGTDSRPARPENGAKKEDSAPRSTDPATLFVRPLSLPRKDEPKPAAPSFVRPNTGPRQDNEATSFIRRPENPTSFIRRDTPPSFTRGTDSTTVNLTRPDPDRRGEWPPPEPPRATPQRVGPTPPEPEEPEPRKSRKPLFITAISIAAVIAIGAGVVFGVPGLSDKLGLTGEDPVAIDPPPAPVSYTPALHGPDAATPAPTQQGVEQALSGPMADPALGNINGVVIDPATGETLYEKNAGDAITPASTGKILTAAAALLSLDPTEQLVTKVVEGDQPGEVIIVGGGDPTISSLEPGKESIYPGAAHLSELVDQVKASGAQLQTVYIDQSRYAAPGLAASWLPADIGAGYIAPIVPAMLDGDRQGDPTENYVARTTDPGRTLVDEFADRIGASPGDSIEKKASANAKVLGEIRSAPITQLVDNMLNRSENTLGDVLAHEVAVKAGDEPSFDGASKAMLDVLRQNDFDVDGVVLRDGSGMSEENKMPARLLADVLAVAASPDGKDPRTAKLRPLLGGLPVAGGSGTLAERYTEADAVAGKGWVRAKTGSLTGINSLAGIVLDKDNRPLVFAFLTSGTVATSARPALDTVTAALRGCGCQ